MIFAKEIARKVKEATLVLTGRSRPEDKQAQIKELAATGARVIYRQVDVTDRKAVDSLIQSVGDDCGGLHGIIHSAGVIKDNFIIKKTKNEFLEVLGPKVTGLVNLDRASKDLKLDFFILFASGAGVMGNPGQSDYSTANAFMDAYARYRNTLVDSNQRHGRTLSLDWPLWKEGGMRVDRTTEKMILQNTGMIAMETRTGIRALYRSLASGLAQVTVMERELPKKPERLSTASPVQSKQAQGLIFPVKPEQLKEKTIYQLKILLGEVIKLSIAKFDTNEPFENYGIDSIMIPQLNQKLADIFGQVSATLFYEYQTLGALGEYRLRNTPKNA